MNSFRQKAKEYFEKVKSKKIVSLVAILLLVLAIPTTVFLAQREQDNRQHAAENQLTFSVNPTTAIPGQNVTVSWNIPVSGSLPTTFVPFVNGQNLIPASYQNITITPNTDKRITGIRNDEMGAWLADLRIPEKGEYKFMANVPQNCKAILSHHTNRRATRNNPQETDLWVIDGELSNTTPSMNIHLAATSGVGYYSLTLSCKTKNYLPDILTPAMITSKIANGFDTSNPPLPLYKMTYVGPYESVPSGTYFVQGYPGYGLSSITDDAGTVTQVTTPGKTVYIVRGFIPTYIFNTMYEDRLNQPKPMSSNQGDSNILSATSDFGTFSNVSLVQVSSDNPAPTNNTDNNQNDPNNSFLYIPKVYAQNASGPAAYTNIALFTANLNASGYGQVGPRMYLNCSTTNSPSAAIPSGSCSYPIPQDLAERIIPYGPTKWYFLGLMAGESDTTLARVPIAIDTTTRINPMTTPPIGVFDGVYGTQLIGWACDLDVPVTAPLVHVYIDDQFGWDATADKTGESAIGPLCGGYKDRRIVTDIPVKYQDGKTHSVKIYAVDNLATGTNTMLNGSPKSFILTVPSGIPSASPVPTATAIPTPTKQPTPTVYYNYDQENNNSNINPNND